VALRLNADGSHPTYSSDLSLSARTNPNADFVAASTFGDRCRSIWLAASNQTYPGPATGFVRRLDTATLKSTGRIDNIVASGLLWAHGSLWVADTEHAAILRIGSAVTRASR
jgi:hypothetical protein